MERLTARRKNGPRLGVFAVNIHKEHHNGSSTLLPARDTGRGVSD
jgi:hypothetical protein